MSQMSALHPSKGINGFVEFQNCTTLSVHAVVLQHEIGKLRSGMMSQLHAKSQALHDLEGGAPHLRG